MTTSLRARVVYPVDRPPIDGGVVTIDGQRIVAVGTSVAGDHAVELGDVALMPGWVNAHTHLEFSYLRRPLGTSGIRLADWIRLVIAERFAGGTLESVSVLQGLNECWRHGATTIADITQRFADEPLGSAAESGSLLLLLEVIGFSRARAESVFAATVDRVDTLAKRVKAEVGLSPHAPYTVSPDLFRRLVQFAQERGLTVVSHLAESPEELGLIRDGTGPFRELLEERSMWDGEAIPRGSRALDYLRMLAEAPRALVIHGNYLDAEERAFLAEHRDQMSLVYCPRTHAYFGHPPYPLEELLAAGVRVALGTDSRASNPDLDMLAEMRHVARFHPGIDPQEVLRMGTLSGAEALGRADTTGSITPGKLANLVEVPLTGASGSAAEILEDVLTSAQGVRAVWMHGDLFGTETMPVPRDT